MAAAAIAAGLMVFAQAGSALACSCAFTALNDQVGTADVVATGTLTDVRDPFGGPVVSSTDPIRYVVDVDRVYKGTPHSRIVFRSARLGASCGLEGMHVDRRYMFLLQRDSGGHLSANLCGGTRLVNGGVESNVTRVTGPPEAPPSAAAGRLLRSDDTSATSTWLPIGVGGLAVGAASAGYLWWRRRSGSAGS